MGDVPVSTEHHATGMGFFQKFPTYPGSEYDLKYELTKDLGRFKVTKLEEDKHMWRVPTWRNVALTAPYFHNGSVPTIEDVFTVAKRPKIWRNADEDAFDEKAVGLKVEIGRASCRERVLAGV